ncbi:hypothetical protein [Longimicrobium sp.]|jgi:hypothetical protein|uniref:hypothetical protein n=1 Tax=Longimicrobium sp. TaxID=2029185 RepID=UPI002F947B4F
MKSKLLIASFLILPAACGDERGTTGDPAAQSTSLQQPQTIEENSQLQLIREPNGLLVYRSRGRNQPCIIPEDYRHEAEAQTTRGGSATAGARLRVLEANASAKAEQIRTERESRGLVRPPEAQAGAVSEFDTCLQYLYGAYTEDEYGRYLRERRGIPSVASEPIQIDTMADPDIDKWGVLLLHDQTNEDYTQTMLRELSNYDLGKLDIVIRGALQPVGNRYTTHNSLMSVVVVGYPDRASASAALQQMTIKAPENPFVAQASVVNLRSLCSSNSFARAVTEIGVRFLRCT